MFEFLSFCTVDRPSCARRCMARAPSPPPPPNVNILFIPFLTVYAIDKLEGNDTTGLKEWTTRVGISPTSPSSRTTQAQSKGNRSLIIFRVAHKIRSERAFSSRADRSKNRLGA